MFNSSSTKTQIHSVNNFHDLVSTAFHGEMNTICLTRQLIGDFSEIVKKVAAKENIMVLDEEELLELQLSEQGQLARDIIVNDMKLLKAHGASPTLNIINYYERDEEHSFFPTDVYSFHVDRSPIPTNTFLCTYYGESSDILPNSQAEQKVFVPEIRNELKKQFTGTDEEFETFLVGHFFDLHYQAKSHAQPINLGLGHLWKLAVDYPESQVLPCIHRAPTEKTGESRLLLIC